jgi:hypothetical protein
LRPGRLHAGVVGVLACLASLVLPAPPAARAAIERFAVVVGHNEGRRDELPLRYAEDDAAKVQEVLRDVGSFPTENIVLLKGEGPDRVRRALVRTNDRIRSVVALGHQAMLLVYVSSHADADAIHLGDASFDIGELQQMVRGSSAAFRLLVLDACRSGSLTRVKGGVRAPPVRLAVDERLAGEGSVFWSSSAVNEDAQESDELKGSFFTHHLVSGLRGPADRDGNGQVSVEEAYRHAYEHTLRATSRTLAGLQHPTYLNEYRGRGDFVLTTPRASGHPMAVVSVPPGRTYLLMRDNAEGPVVAEVAAADEVRAVSVRPGRYFVRARGARHLLEGTVAFAAGAVTTVRDDALERIEYARLARKGRGEPIARGALLGWTVRNGLWPGASVCQGPVLGLEIAGSALSAAVRAHGCQGGFRNEAVRATAREAGADLRVAHAWDRGALSVDLGITFGVRLLHERFETRGVAPPRWAIAPEGGAGFGLRYAVSGPYELVAELGGHTVAFRSQTEDRAPALRFSFLARGAVGLLRAW